MPSPRILIVEDEAIIAADLKDRLEDQGYRPYAVVDTGEAAIETVRRELPDLILMDINLAGTLDGVETALAIAEIASIPLVFLTSNSDEATYRRARRARPRAFLSKPFRGRDLFHTIDLVLDRAAEEQSTPAAAQPAGSESDVPADENAVRYEDRLFIRVKERLVRLMLSDILYVEADDYYCKVVTEGKAYLVTKTLKKLAALLPQESFLRCHRSYVVNLSRITEIGEIYVFLGKHRVSVSRNKRADLLRLLAQ